MLDRGRLPVIGLLATDLVEWHQTHAGRACAMI
jgi:hypothetical protein